MISKNINLIETVQILQHQFLEIYCNYSHEEAGKLSALFAELFLQELQIQALIKQIEEDNSNE